MNLDRPHYSRWLNGKARIGVFSDLFNFSMAIQQGDYENLLARCSDYQGALALLKQQRPYLEM